MLRFFVFISIFFVSACNQPERFDNLSCDQEHHRAYTLCGAINEASVNQAVEAFQNDPRLTRLFISSGGGFMSDQYRLLNYIDEKQIDIVVFDRCLSACFLMIALTRQDVYVTQGTMLGNHHNPYALSRMLQSAGLSDMSLEWRAMIGAGMEDFQALSARGVDERLFLGGLYYKNIRCVNAFKKDSQGRFITQVQTINQHEYWVPSREIFNKLTGKDVTGWWPTEIDVQLYVRTLSRPFTYEDTIATASEMYAHFSELEMCSNEP